MSAVLTTAQADSAKLSDALDAAFAGERLLVVGLCAAWCGTCTMFRAAFERIAASRHGAAFVWLDVDYDSHLAGDIDVENFPTLAIYREGRVLHYGVSLPHEKTVARLIDSLSEHGDAANPRPTQLGVPLEVVELPRLMKNASAADTLREASA